MKTFNPNIYFTTPEVSEVLNRIPATVKSERERCIVKAFHCLKAKHGHNANITDADVCNFIHAHNWHLQT